MKLLVDAQLPTKLARFLKERGHDARHTRSLPKGNFSSDQQVTEAADREDRVVVSKDADFRNSHEIEGAPRRLLVVAVGNMPNRDLLAIFDEHLDALVEAFDDSDHVEIRSTAIVAYPRSAGRRPLLPLLT